MKKLILAALFSTCFFSCGEESSGPDKDPPEIKSISPDTMRIIDTLHVAFTEKIDTGSIRIEADNGEIDFSFVNEKELQIFGKNTTAKVRHFNINTPLGIQINNLMDLEGNVNNLSGENNKIKPVVYTWADNDFFMDTYNLGDTLRDTVNLNIWKSGLDISETYLTEGLLMPEARTDQVDYKIIALKPLDNVSFELSCPSTGNFAMIFYGPFMVRDFEKNFADVRETVSESDTLLFLERVDCTDKNKTVAIENHEIDYKHHSKLGITGTEYFYVVKIFSPLFDHSGFYSLKIKLSPY